MKVKEVLNHLSSLGLDIRTGSSHYKVYDPVSGAWLFSVSHTPSDVNWHHQIKRHIRRIGLSWDAPTKTRYKQKPAVDLLALAKAQADARAAGQREPQLSDLDETTDSEFWSRTRSKGAQLTEAAQEEVITQMPVSAATASRAHLVRARLNRVLSEKQASLEKQARERNPTTPAGKGAKSQFVWIAINQVAQRRGMRAWKNEGAGQQAVSSLLKGNAVVIWGLDLIDATIDHLDGLQWGKQEEPFDHVPLQDPERSALSDGDQPAEPLAEAMPAEPESAPKPPEQPASEPEPLPEPPPDVHPILDQDQSPQQRYVNLLLSWLERYGLDTPDSKDILDRIERYL